jgi:hypothetical protein
MTKTTDRMTGRGASHAAMQTEPENAMLQAEPQILSDDFIGRALKAHFEDIAGAPVPDKFLVLLAELEAKEQGHAR